MLNRIRNDNKNTESDLMDQPWIYKIDYNMENRWKRLLPLKRSLRRGRSVAHHNQTNPWFGSNVDPH